MCGFLIGPTDTIGGLESVARGALRHRGADGLFGSFHARGWTGFHSRLALQSDDEEGAQPFTGHDFAHYAFVGEFFDGPRRGFHDHPEFDIMLTALSTPYMTGLHNVDGFWSIARVRSSGQLEIITDHLGIKPVYHWPERDLFCSELEPMFDLFPRPPLDEAYLGNCVKFGYDHSGRTPYQGIYQIAPGTVTTFTTVPDLFLDPPYVHQYRYWAWARVPGADRPLRELCDEAIQNRLLTWGHPVGLLLSGGLDSSIIYYALKAMGREGDVVPFSIENEETSFLPNDPNLELLPRPEGAPDWDEVLLHNQVPVDLGSAIPQVELAKAVRSLGLRTCLSGDGADELFGGYRRAREYDSQHSDTFSELPYYHLPRLDRVMMRQGVELRSPYLSPRVAAHALLHVPYGLRKGVKTALQWAYEDVVPGRILNRPKHPLKSPQVLSGGVEYRMQLTKEFRRWVNQTSTI